jgi:hypothetical protein
MPMYEGEATVFGGLRVWAQIYYEKGDGWMTDDDAHVEEIYWLKRNGQKGKPFSKKLWERLDRDKNNYWQADVIEQVFDYVSGYEPNDEKVQLND